MSTTEADIHPVSPGTACERPGRLVVRCVAGVARGFSQASLTFAEELARDSHPAALPSTSLTAFLSANARLFHEIAAVAREVTDEYDSVRSKSRTDEIEYEALAQSIAAHMAAEEPAAPNPRKP